MHKTKKDVDAKVRVALNKLRSESEVFVFWLIKRNIFTFFFFYEESGVTLTEVSKKDKYLLLNYLSPKLLELGELFAFQKSTAIGLASAFV